MLSRRLLARIAPWWIACVIVGSLIPGEGKKAIGTLTSYEKAVGGELRWQHRAAHFLVFGSTALLSISLTRTRTGGLLAVVATIGLGCVLEEAQNLIYLQGFEWWDVRDDSIAALVVYAGAVSAADRMRIVRE